MQQYTLAKACDSCISSKKRCDKFLPRCTRCLGRSIICRYRNEPLAQALTGRHDPSLDPTPGQASDATGAVMRYQSQELYEGGPEHLPGTELTSIRLPEPGAIYPFDKESYLFLASLMRACPIMLVDQGSNHFIHRQLYDFVQPHLPLRIVHRICRENIDLLRRGKDIAPDTLSPAIQSLASAPEATVSFTDCLGLVQALITIQALTLFSFDLSPVQQREVDQRQQVLVEWTHKLWEMAPTKLPSTFDACQAYVFAESVRRTILTASMLQALNKVKHTGQAQHTLFIAALPLGAHMHLWEDCPKDAQCREIIANAPLVSYREYTDSFFSRPCLEPTLFENLLLVGCQGLKKVNDSIKMSQMPAVAGGNSPENTWTTW